LIHSFYYRLFYLSFSCNSDLPLEYSVPGSKLFTSKTWFMYIIRDIFYLHFGHYRPAKQLLDEALKAGLLPENKQARVLSDFTGDAYRLIFEEGFNTLAEYEQSLTGSMRKDEWQQWYDRFKPHVERSHREILKLVI